VLRYCQNFVGFLIGYNFFIAIVASSIALSGFILFNTTSLFLLVLLVFFATQTAYNLQRYFKWRKKIIHPFLLKLIPTSNNAWLILIVPGLLISAFFLFILQPTQLIFLLVVGSVTSLYLFVHPISKKLTGLRYIPFMKTFFVALCWTGLFFTLSFENNHWFNFQQTWEYWLLIFLEILQACILFDLRDIENDKGQVKTFANMLNTLWIMVVWTLLEIPIIILLLNQTDSFWAVIVLAVIASAQIYCIIKKTNALYFTFIIDGSLLLFSLVNYLAFTHA
jgi:4-hydroxybenzoate polyprenyltransferase